MLLTKNIIVNPEMFPIIGESNAVTKEISKRFTKYYKRGIKNENRKKLLGYNLLVPKAFSKFESQFREDIMMLEVKINKKSSILIPSFYTSFNLFENIFELENRKSLKDIYDFKEGKLIINESVPSDPSSPAVNMNVAHKMGAEHRDSGGWISKLFGKIFKKGKGKKIKSFAKEYLRRHFPDDTTDKWYNKIMNWNENPPYGLKPLGNIGKYSVNPILYVMRGLHSKISVGNPNSRLNIKGGDQTISSNVKKLVASDADDLKAKTADLLNKIYKDGDEKNEFISAVCSIYENPDDIQSWLNTLERVNCKRLLKAEEDMFEACTKTFAKAINWGGIEIPETPEEARSNIENQKISTYKGVDKVGLLTSMFKIFKGQIFTRWYNAWKGKKELSTFSTLDVDQELMVKLNKLTKHMSKDFTNAQSEDFIGTLVKNVGKPMLHVLYISLAYGVIFGSIPFEVLLKNVGSEAERRYNVTPPSTVKEYVEEVKSTKKIFEMLANEENIVQICDFSMSSKGRDLINRHIPKTPAEIMEHLEWMSFICKGVGEPNIKNLTRLTNALESNNFSDSEVSEFITKHAEKYLQKSLEEVQNDRKLRVILKKQFLIFSKNLNDKTTKAYSSGWLAREKSVGTLDELVEGWGQAEAAIEEADKISDQIVELTQDSDLEANLLKSVTDEIKNNPVYVKKIGEHGKRQIMKFLDVIKKRAGESVAVNNTWSQVFGDQLHTIILDAVVAIWGTGEDWIGDGPHSKTLLGVQDFILKKENVGRVNAVFCMILLCTIVAYKRNSAANLTKRIADFFMELIVKTNVFKVLQVEIAIETIQVVLFSTFNESFKDIFKKANSGDYSEPPFSKDEVKKYIELCDNLNNCEVKKVVMSNDEINKIKIANSVPGDRSNTSHVKLKLSYKGG